ncbi:MAG: AAA family ATPase [Planctomycetaceae bacterium]|nr:AAA family ATPase [Planctomycetaceae bacterium]
MSWQRLQTASCEQIIEWAQTQDWCRDMAACVQDSEWHAEGDVWTHTKRVLHELGKLDEWSNLTPHEQTVLKFTALFHDVAKPVTTEVDAATGRVRSPKHAVKGEYITRNILRKLECDMATREEIVRMVRFHGRPVFLMERAEPAQEVIRLSWLLSNRLLFLFAVADTRGRDTDSLGRPEETLQYWKLLAQEHQCYTEPFPFASDEARFRYFRCSEPDIHYVPHPGFKCTVTMMSGLPGSGKDTWIAKHRRDMVMVSLDDLRAELDVDASENQGRVAQAARERCREHLRAGESFVFNATNLLRQTRSRWVDLFDSYKAKVEIVYLEPTWSELLRQNRNRSQPIPESAIYRLAEKCEPPTWHECHELILQTGAGRGSTR